jgi:sec-independent protein translocase protein TatC
LPAATYVGARLELIDAPFLKKYRRHAIVINTILAAALTPGQDPFSMILMAVPMIVMYELSIIIARYVNPVSEVAVHELAHSDDEEDEVDDIPEREEEEVERDL